MTIEQFENYSVTFGVAGLILYMVFIIWRLGKESEAGKFGYFVLFLALGLGFVSYAAKSILIEFLHI
jgi:hypothetical protein